MRIRCGNNKVDPRPARNKMKTRARRMPGGIGISLISFDLSWNSLADYDEYASALLETFVSWIFGMDANDYIGERGEVIFTWLITKWCDERPWFRQQFFGSEGRSDGLSCVAHPSEKQGRSLLCS